ncbi:MAG: hypothetical protein KAH30_01295, partial [Caldisericia bacterium]|nr:hypothetical protein [Caldisericia bacterium]
MKTIKKSLTVFLCVLFACSMFVMLGCEKVQKEIEYSAIWTERYVDRLDRNRTEADGQNTQILYYDKFPGSKGHATMVINSTQKTSFQFSSDVSWITFREKGKQETTSIFGEIYQPENTEKDEQPEPQILEIICFFQLPENIELPTTPTITITPSNGKETTLKIIIKKPEWSVSWVSTATDSITVNMQDSLRKKIKVNIQNDSNTTMGFNFVTSSKEAKITGRNDFRVEADSTRTIDIDVGSLVNSSKNKSEEWISVIPGIAFIDKSKKESLEKLYSKKLNLLLIKEEDFFDFVWEETGTKMITIKQNENEHTIKNIIFKDSSKRIKSFSILNLDVLGSEKIGRWIKKSDDGIYPVLITGEDKEIQIEVEFSNDYELKKSLKITTLEIKNEDRPHINLSYETVWKMEGDNRDCLFTDDQIFKIDNTNNGQIIKCFDIITKNLEWEYPKKDNPDYKKLIETPSLGLASKKYEKVITSYGSCLSYSGIKPGIVCLDTRSGEPVWTKENTVCITLFKNSEKVLIFENRCDYVSKNKKDDEIIIGYYRCININTGEQYWELESKSNPCTETYLNNDGEFAYFEGCSGYAEKRITIDGTTDYFRKNEIPEFILNQYFTRDIDPSKYFLSWEYDNRKRYFTPYEIYDDAIGLPSYDYKAEVVYSDELIIRTINWAYSYTPHGHGVVQVFNAETGDLITSSYNIDSFEMAGDILEVGGYFFGVPSGEHIDLPVSYRLQHYSETTGNYYF